MPTIDPDMDAVEARYAEVRKEHPEWAPQPCFLVALRRVVEAKNGGKRDERAEQDLFGRYITQRGILTLEALLARPVT